jgi:hypothetical protein
MAIHTTSPNLALYQAPAVVSVEARRHRPWKAKRHATLLEWAEVRRLHTEGVSPRVISRTLRLSRRSVRQILYPWHRS